jgi:hypothetical protein
LDHFETWIKEHHEGKKNLDPRTYRSIRAKLERAGRWTFDPMPIQPQELPITLWVFKRKEDPLKASNDLIELANMRSLGSSYCNREEPEAKKLKTEK